VPDDSRPHRPAHETRGGSPIAADRKKLKVFFANSCRKEKKIFTFVKVKQTAYIMLRQSSYTQVIIGHNPIKLCIFTGHEKLYRN
jgi:hypothetical protein